MVKEEFINFWEWIGPAAGFFFVILCVCIVLGTIYGFMVSAVRNGPGEAFYSVATVIAQAVPDLFRTSPRRVAALAKLAIQEAIRRRIILVTFAIFASALLIGGWFLDVSSDRPNEIYLSVVLFGTQLLVLLVAVMISCFSLPQDIRNRTIYTVVTKPVRAFEIVLGRILGFGAMCTLLLAAMGIISYFFVQAGLSHDHSVEIGSFEEVDQRTGITPTGRRASINAVLEGASTYNSHHRHRIEVIQLDDSNDDAMAGKERFAIQVLATAGHGHEGVTIDGNRPSFLSEDGVFTFDAGDDALPQIIDVLNDESGSDDLRIRLGKPKGYLESRVPYYASELRFLDRAGNDTAEGVSVGDEWEYRSYIDGGTSQSRAIFKFEDFKASRFREGEDIPLELTLGVFRTHKGNIERRVTGTITLKSEVDDIVYESDPFIFESQEFQVQELRIPRTVTARWTDENGTPQSKQMSLFDEFAPEGKMEVWLRCNEGGQFFGVARADVYFREKEGAFFVNFFKGFLSIWLQMMIMISMGVMFSTFVSGPVAMMGCISLWVMMSNSQFIHDVANRKLEGGGPIEATWRMITQNNVTNELESGITITVVQSIDWIIMKVLDIMATSIPNMGQIDTMENLARGYDISMDLVCTNVAVAFGFCLVVAMIGYFRLKTREIAA